MIIYYSSNDNHIKNPLTKVSRGFGYKIKSNRKPKNTKLTTTKVSTSKSKPGKFKTLKKENILFLRKLGFSVTKK